jgi:glycosyltransferase involved in cell wall biosynthesis
VDAVTVCYILIQLEAGGAERQLVALLEGLDRTRFRPIVVVERPGGTFEPAVRDLGIPIHTLARRVRWDPFVPFRLARLLRRERVDVVQTISPMWNVYGVLAAVLAGVPVRLMSWRNIRYSLPHTALIWLMTPLADRLIANSQHAARRLRRWFVPRSRVMAIPNGIDCARFDSRPDLDEKRRELGLGDDGPLIGMVARLWAQKDHATLIEAVARLLARYPRLVLLVIGDGPLRTQIKALANRLLPPGRCRMLGRRRDTVELYHLLDVAVLSTHYEGMPNVVMEAMASRRPVVATAVDGCAELIEDGVTGLLVPRRDPRALAEAIARVLDDNALAARLSEAGRRHMREEYSLEQLSERHERLYTELLARKRKTRAQ